MVKPESSNRGQRINNGSNGRYKGVRMRKWGKWVAEIRLPNCRDRVWLGSYETPEKAARAYDAAAYCIRGPTTEFNFPNAAPPDIPASRNILNPQLIQAVASRHAQEEPAAVVMEDGHYPLQFPAESEPTTSNAVQNPSLFELPQAPNEAEELNWPTIDSTFSPDNFDGFLSGF